MPRYDFPGSNEPAGKPISFTNIHRSVTPTSSSDNTQVPWRPVVTAAASLGAPASIGLLHPMLGEVIAVIELVVLLTIVGTALFGSQTLSERAFRLLRWLGNRPEPTPPSTAQWGDVGDPRSHTPPGEESSALYSTERGMQNA